MKSGPALIGILLLSNGLALAQQEVIRAPDASGEPRTGSDISITRTPEQSRVVPALPKPPAESVQPEPAGPEAPAATPTAHPGRFETAPMPDERVLWKLFHARRFGELERQMRAMRAGHPQWRPPRKLTALLWRARNQAAIRAARRRGDVAGLIRLAQQRPQLFGCANPDGAWALAQAFGAAQQWDRAVAVYAGMAGRCSTAIAKASLEKAAVLLPDDAFERLQAEVHSAQPSAEPALTGIAYEREKRQYLAAREAADQAAMQRLRVQLEPQILAHGDADLAAVLGWDDFNQGRPAQAARWFEEALKNAPQQEDSRYGLALAERKAGRPEAAEAVIGPHPVSSRMRRLLGEIRLERAWSALRDGDPGAAADNLARARPLLGENREADSLDAWVHYRRGDYAYAGKLFDSLYRRRATADVAEGLALSYGKLDPQNLAFLADAGQEPLKRAIVRQQAEEFFGRKLFLASHAVSAEANPALENVDGEYLGAGMLMRDKSGESGLGRLTILERPFVEAVHVHGGIERFGFKAAALDLDSGSPSPCSAFGSKADGCQAFARPPLAGVHDAALVEFSWYREGWTSPYFTLGATPLNAPVAALPTFRLGMIRQERWGRWQAEGFSQSVRDSLLSYAGQQDAYGSKDWGRVLRSGGTFTIFKPLNERWGLNTEGSAAYLGGRHVADNWMAAASVGAGYNFALSGFDYFSLGPAVSYQHYDRNLYHYTLGHGGYFSPQQFVNLGLGVNFLTAEARPAIAKGRLSIGYQHFTESSTPWYPDGTPSGRHDGFYAAHRFDGMALDLELKGAWLIAPNWMLAAGAAFRQTSGFQDVSAGFAIRYLLDSRKAAVSSDIPDGFFRSVY